MRQVQRPTIRSLASSAETLLSTTSSRPDSSSAPTRKLTISPGWFSQTHEAPELLGRALLDVLWKEGLDRGAAMARLRRYELHEAAEQSFETLSGGQQARFQILIGSRSLVGL